MRFILDRVRYENTFLKLGWGPWATFSVLVSMGIQYHGVNHDWPDIILIVYIVRLVKISIECIGIDIMNWNSMW